MNQSPEIRIGMTREFFASGAQIWNQQIFNKVKNLPGVVISVLPSTESGVTADDLSAHDILVVRKTGVPQSAFQGLETARTRLICRFGVGYDHIAMEDCTRHGITVTITPDGVRRPVASSIATLVMSLAHRVKEKDALIRVGKWPEGRDMRGSGLEGRVLASIGFGNIAREAFRLLTPFGMRFIASDPQADMSLAKDLGVEIVSFDQALQEADFLTLNCPLMPSTRHIIDAKALARMKPSAYLINTARGALVSEDALVTALKHNALAGAGLDVFETEPTGADNPLFDFPNVIASPHSMCWTDECAKLTSQSVHDTIRAWLANAPLQNIVNPSVLVGA